AIRAQCAFFPPAIDRKKITGVFSSRRRKIVFYVFPILRPCGLIRYLPTMETIMRILLALILLGLITTTPARAATGHDVSYRDGNTELQGYWVDARNLPERDHRPAPVVLIVHQWMGLTDYEKGRAEQIADLGYNAFAVDMYGKGVRPANTDEAGKTAGIYK